MKTYCKDCEALLKDGDKLIRGHGGEQITSKWPPFKKIWVYRCLPCRDKAFISMVNSDPRIKHRYHEIYGKTVEEVLK